MKKFYKNLRFRSKIILIFGIMFFFTTAISGFTYYRYTSHDIEENFKVSAESVLTQIADTLDMRLGVIRQRAQGMLTNYTFVVSFSDYLNNPNDLNLGKNYGDRIFLFKGFRNRGKSAPFFLYLYRQTGNLIISYE